MAEGRAQPGRRQPSNWASRRRAELDERLREIAARSSELSSWLSANGDERQQRFPVGSSPAHVERAETLARLASERATTASRRAALMRVHAAAAHERVAQTLQALADAHTGNLTAHRARADWHRRQAAADRAAAEEIFESLRTKPPPAGED